jgi:hypothetical protein
MDKQFRKPVSLDNWAIISYVRTHNTNQVTLSFAQQLRQCFLTYVCFSLYLQNMSLIDSGNKSVKFALQFAPQHAIVSIVYAYRLSHPYDTINATKYAGLWL